MKKTLIALAMTVLPVAAMAEVTIYGTMKGGVEYTQVLADGATTITNLNDWGSKIGFKGSEDIGSLKAIWKFENKLSLDHMSRKRNKWGTGTTYVGLETPFGTLRAGYMDDAIGEIGDLDIFDGNGIRTIGGTWGDLEGKFTSLRYDTPDPDALYGFSAMVTYTPSDNAFLDDFRDKHPDVNEPSGFVKAVGDPVFKGGDTADHIVSAGLAFERAGFWAKYGFRMAGNDKWSQAHRVVVGYNSDDVWMLGLGFQAGKGAEKEDKWSMQAAASASYNYSNIEPKLSVVYDFGQESVKNSDYVQVIAGVDYHLSKRTKAIANVGWMNAGNGAKQMVANSKADRNNAISVGVGLSHKF